METNELRSVVPCPVIVILFEVHFFEAQGHYRHSTSLYYGKVLYEIIFVWFVNTFCLSAAYQIPAKVIIFCCQEMKFGMC